MIEFQKAAGAQPKNIRQVGEQERRVSLYVEDYVNTFLKRMVPPEGQRTRGGLLLGHREEGSGTAIFLDGALELSGLVDQKGQPEFSEELWKRAYQEIEDHFPKRTVQGWFLCGSQDSVLNPLPLKKPHSRYFPEKDQLLFLTSRTEGAEKWYVADGEGFYGLQGYSIYYERNQMMQDYLVSLRGAERVETGGSDPVIRDFRRKMEERRTKNDKQGHFTLQTLRVLCSVLTAAALAGAVVTFRSLEKLKVVETAVMAVVPEWKSEHDILTVGQAIIKSRAGQLFDRAETEAPEQSSLLFEGPASEFPTVAAPETALNPETYSPQALAPTVEEFPGSEESKTSSEPEAEQNLEQKSGSLESQEITAAVSELAPEAAVTAEAASAETPVFRQLEPAPGQSVYLVKEGETLYGICFQLYQNLSHVDEICQINGITDVNRLEAGSRLIVP